MVDITTAYVMATKKRGAEGEAVRELLARDSSSGVEAKIVYDPGESPWDCYSEILRIASGVEDDSRFFLICQDDMAMPLGFLDSVKTILQHAPVGFISFYMNTNKGMTEAGESGHHVYRSRYNWHPPCHAFPYALLKDLLEYCDENFPPSYYSEDGRILKYMRDRVGLYWYTIVPSLTQHLGAYRSSLGIPGRVGKYVRCSSMYQPGFEVDMVDWEAEFTNPFTTKNQYAESHWPFDGYKKSIHGGDLSQWTLKAGKPIKS